MAFRKSHIKKTYCITAFLLFVFSNSSAVNGVTITDINNHFANGDLAFCRSNIAEVERKNPNNSNVVFLKGLLETDGEKSLSCFKEITEKFKTSSKFSASTSKIVEYEKISSLIVNNVIPQAVIPQIIPTTKKDVKVVNNLKNTVDVTLFYLQLGAYSSKNNAEKTVKELAEFKPFIKNSTINGKTLYLIFSGAYESKEIAEKNCDKVYKVHNIKALVKEF